MRYFILLLISAFILTPAAFADQEKSSRARLLELRNSWILSSPPSKVLHEVYTRYAREKAKRGDKKSALILSEAALEHVRHLDKESEKKVEAVALVKEHYKTHKIDVHDETLHKVANTPYVREHAGFLKKEPPSNFHKESFYLDRVREADLLATEGEEEKAEKLYVEALNKLEKLKSTDGMLLVRLVDRVTRLFYRDGKFSQAEEIIREHLYRHDSMYERLGPQDEDRLQIAFLLSDLSLVYCGMNRYVEAEALNEEALQIVKQFHTEKDADYVVMLGALARLHKYMGKYKESEKEYRRAISLAEDEEHVSRNTRAIIMGNYYKLLTKMGKTRLAAKVASEANSLRAGTVK